MAKDIQWFPGHMAKALREISERIKVVDIVIELCDARAPYSSINPELFNIINTRLLNLNNYKTKTIISTNLDIKDINDQIKEN